MLDVVLGARAAAVLPQAIGQAGSGGPVEPTLTKTTARDKNYHAAVIMNVTTWDDNTTKDKGG